MFTNLDASSMFHQFPVDRKCARRNFCVHALGRLWIFLRLLMGLNLSPPICQSFVDKAFQCHERCKAFLDDIMVWSLNMLKHLHEDLPKALAIASYYNILLKPAKADLMRPSTCILGHQLSESAITLSAEKIDKISV